jgi:hypothetical protein
MINLRSLEYQNFEDSILILIDDGATTEELKERLDFIIKQREIDLL